jgi:hypothetical protein
MAKATATYVIKLQNRTKKAFNAIGRSLKRTTSAVFSLKTGFVSLAGLAGIGFFIKKSLDATDEMAKMSRAIGVSVESLQRLRHAANLGGMQSKQLDKAVQKLAVNMADMSRGVGLAKDVFEKYNISVLKSDGTLRGVTDVLADVADVTAGMTNKTEKADLAYKLFGARGAEMINVLEGGSAAMHATMLEADKLGLVMSAETAKGVEDANDAMTRLSSFLTSTFTQAVAKLAPAIEAITNNIRDWVEMRVGESGGIGAIARDMAEAIVVSAVNILAAFEKMGNGLIEFVNTVRKSLPEALGGFRDTKEILEEIAIVEARIGQKDIAPKMQRGAIMELARLNKELDNANDTQIKFKFDNSQLRKSLLDTLPVIRQTTKSLSDLSGASEAGTTASKENTIWSKMGEGFKKYKADVSKGNLTIADATLKGMGAIEDGIVNMVMGVKTSFKDMARSILADLIRMQVRALLVRSISGGFGFSLPGFAAGGRPTPNQPSIVGERGAELFVPDRAGTIVPNHQLNTATGEVKQVSAEINFNVQAIDAASFNNYLVNNRGTIESIINSSLTSNGSVRRTIKQVV